MGKLEAKILLFLRRYRSPLAAIGGVFYVFCVVLCCFAQIAPDCGLIARFMVRILMPAIFTVAAIYLFHYAYHHKVNA